MHDHLCSSEIELSEMHVDMTCFVNSDRSFHHDQIEK